MCLGGKFMLEIGQQLLSLSIFLKLYNYVFNYGTYQGNFNFESIFLQSTMRIIIRENYDSVSEYVAAYIKQRILTFNPTPEKPFVLGFNSYLVVNTQGYQQVLLQ